MHPLRAIRQKAKDPLATFRIFETLIALFCMAMPWLLGLADTTWKGYRICISEYAYMPQSLYFGMLLAIPAMLFIFNGAVYFKNESSFKLSKAGKWYNVILGLALLGVILTPYHEHFYSHMVSACIFFGGNAIVIALFHRRKYRVISLILAALTILGLALNQLDAKISLFTAEWISLAVIGIHFILEAAGAIKEG